MREVFSYEKLLEAYFSCRKSKRKTINALKFEFDFEKKLLVLQKKLKNHTYRPGRSICFVVTHPKLREVFAADFVDRVVHHFLVNELEPYFEKRFIYNSFACRKGKGVYEALKKLRSGINKVTKNKTRNAFYAQLDIKSFFMRIDKNILFSILEKEIKKMNRNEEWKKEILWLAKITIFHNPTKNYYFKGNKNLLKKIPAHKTLFRASDDKGLPIGNLTSQFFANVYLNVLDQFIKHQLKIKYYFRYVDDFVLLFSNTRQLKEWRNKINQFLIKGLNLELHSINSNKQIFESVYSGINFLGYIIKPSYMLVRKRVVKSFKTKLFYLNQGLYFVSNNQKQKFLRLDFPLRKDQIQKAEATVNSYYGHFCYANSYNLRKNIYNKHFKKIKKHLRPKEEFSYFEAIKV